MRYQRKDIQEHLAQQYVLGHLSGRVKRRVEVLIKHDQVFEEVIYKWQAHLATLMHSVADEKPPQRVWKALERKTEQASASSDGLVSLWRYAGLVSFVMLCTVSLLLWQQLQEPVLSHQSTPGYLAIMSTPEQPQTTAFVLAAYQGKKPGHSVLKLQWEQSQSEQDRTRFKKDKLFLWSIERDTGNRFEIGLLSSLTADGVLSKDAWLKIKNSAELQISLDGKVVFQGPCLQLAKWQKS
jgi:anti-sigma-K factor RskA